MKIIPVQQGSVEWMLARSGIPTASEFDRLLTPKLEPRKWTTAMPNTYCAAKIAEAWQGGPLPGFTSQDMEFGTILEKEAIPKYELEFSEDVQRVGLVTTNDGLVGCSPDGLIGDDGGLECKCPGADTHTRYCLAGELPEDYAAQVHGAMFVTGRAWWKFMSYRRHFPLFVLLVERDEAIQERIADALAMFKERFDEGFAKMVRLNGGRPERKAPPCAVPPDKKEEAEKAKAEFNKRDDIRV